MAFLNPILAIVGLACVAVPILIHILLRRRRRPIAWGAMKFLLEAYRQQRRRLRFEQWLLLASRCLLVALLALAVGKPVVGAAGRLGPGGPRTLYLLVDNSLTSGARDESGKIALDRHKDRALALLRELDPARGDRAGILALGGPAEGALLPATTDLEAAASAVRDLAGTASACDWSGALALLRDQASEKSPGLRQAAILSEFRLGGLDARGSMPAALGEGFRTLATLPATGVPTNVSIAGMRVLAGVVIAGEDESSVPVRVELRRSGAGVGAGGVTTLVVGAWTPGMPDSGARESRTARQEVAWAKGEEAKAVTVTLPLAKRSAGMVLRATIDRDAIEADNTLEVPMEVRQRLRVALIATAGEAPATIDAFRPVDWLRLALNPSDEGSLGTRRAGDVSIAVLDPSREVGAPGGNPLAGMDAVVIAEPEGLDEAGWARVRGVLDAGALVLVFPSRGSGASVWTDAFTRELGLDWTLAREGTVYEAPARLVVPAGDESGLLSQLGAELGDLARPVGVSRVLKVEAPSGSARPILALEDGSAFVLAGHRAEGSRGVVVYVGSAMDLSWTDLPARPLMIPLVQEVLRQGIGRATGMRSSVAGTSPSLPGATEVARITIDGSAGRSIPITPDTNLARELRTPGVYRVRGAGGVVVGQIAVVPDPGAGRVDPQGRDEVGRWLAGITGEVRWIEVESGEAGGSTDARPGALVDGDTLPPISLPLLIAAGVVALAELGLGRVFSHARQVEGAPEATDGRAAA